MTEVDSELAAFACEPSSQEQVDSWREHFGENLNFQYVFALDQRHFIPVLSYDQLSFEWASSLPWTIYITKNCK